MTSKTIVQRTLSTMALLSGGTFLSERFRDHALPPYIRIVSYHATDRIHEANLERHFRFFAERYRPARWSDLTDHLDGTRPWAGPKPGILIAFDDGGVSNFTVARPLLRRYGLTGIFLIPTDWIDLSVGNQPDYADAHKISTAKTEPDRGRGMSWEQIRELAAEGDKIVSHTRSHYRFADGDGEAALRREIVESKAILEDRLGIEIDSFGWVGGESSVYVRKAFEMIRAASYRYVLSTVLGPILAGTDPQMIRRTALNDDWPLSQVRFWLLPPSDRRYRAKEAAIRKQLGLS